MGGHVINVRIEWTFDVATDEGESLDLHAEGERVMEALMDIEAANDCVDSCATSTDLSNHTMTFDVSAKGSTFEDAVGTAMSAIRAAVHATGADTSDFPAPIEFIAGSLRYRAGNLDAQPQLA